MFIQNSNDIPASWGDYILLRKNQLVTIREVAEGGEEFVKSWGTLNAVPGVDYIIQVGGVDQYPIKKDEFAASYMEVDDGYLKRAFTKVVKIPEGINVELDSKEGIEVVRYPDVVAVDSSGGVYAFPYGKNVEGDSPTFVVVGTEQR